MNQDKWQRELTRLLSSNLSFSTKLSLLQQFERHITSAYLAGTTAVIPVDFLTENDLV